MDAIRWGILGTGGIARTFAEALRLVPDARLAAVASRSAAKAREFADRHGGERAWEGVEALVADPGVDAVYIATPHPEHRHAAVAALAAGKHVLCEKPIAMSAAEAQDMVDAARRGDRFLMEAMWTRFLPAVAQARAWIRGGAIGEPRQVQADFSFDGGWWPESRLLNPALGGGALLDVGVYAIALAGMAFGAAPEAVQAVGHVGATGVDEQVALALRFPGGGIASLTCGVRANGPQEAWITGTAGRIRLPDFWHAQRAELHRQGAPAECLDLPFRGNGFPHQIEAVHRCLRAGERECAEVPWADSLATMRVIDAARRQLGLLRA